MAQSLTPAKRPATGVLSSPDKAKKVNRRAGQTSETGATAEIASDDAANGTSMRRRTLKKTPNASGFRAIRSTVRLPLAPVFAEDPMEGVRQALESWIMRYVPALDAVLLTVSWPPTLLDDNAPLAPSSAFALARVQWEGVGFRPEIGSSCTGKLSLATPSVVSLLVHNLFNASITAEQIPQDEYEWDPDATLPYSLAPPSMLGKSSTNAHAEGSVVPETDTEGSQDGEAKLVDAAEQGCWVHSATREPLGGADGLISFTVTGLTIANSMISVHGSLKSDENSIAKSGRVETVKSKRKLKH